MQKIEANIFLRNPYRVPNLKMLMCLSAAFVYDFYYVFVLHS